MSLSFDLSEIAEMLPESVLFLSGEGIVLAANAQAAAVLNLPLAQLVGRSLCDLVSDPLEKVDEYLHLSRRNRQPILDALSWRLGNGAVRLLRCECALVHPATADSPSLLMLRQVPADPSGERFVALNHKIAALSREISRRTRIEQELSFLASMVESSDDAIIGKDLDGIITSWNKGAERLYGYTAAEVVGKPIAILSPPERPNEIPSIMEKLRRGERLDHFETERIARDGRRFAVSLTISPVCDESGTIIGASAIARDISSRKAAEEAVRRSEKLAVTGRLAATIAHEINNPLEAVTNLIYLAMAEVPPNSQACGYLQSADEELGRVAQIARQTLGFHRDAAGPSVVTVSRLLDDVLSLNERKLQGRRIMVDRRYEIAGSITAIPGEIRQVLANLVSNAIDAMPSGGKLRLHVYSSCNWNGAPRPGVRVTVADQGTGIPPAVRHRLFEAFFTTKQDVGTGLGLWISRGIMQKHGGNIHVRSCTRPPHNGTVFSLFFPVAISVPADSAA